MYRSVFDQQLNQEPTTGRLRKVIDLLHLHTLPAKMGISIFSGAILFGTGLVFATAQANHVNAPSVYPPSVTPNVTDQMQIAQPLQATVNSSNSFNLGTHSEDTGSQTGDHTNNAYTHTKVVVNGESITVPANGTVHQIITNDNGSASVDVTSKNSNQNGTTSYTNVQTNSSSSGTTNITSTTQSGASN